VCYNVFTVNVITFMSAVKGKMKPMQGFQKGNTLWAIGVKQRKANKDRVQAFLDTIADQGIDAYMNKLIRLAKGNALNPYEMQFLNRFEGWRDFIASRKSTKVETEVNIGISVYLPKREPDAIPKPTIIDGEVSEVSEDEKPAKAKRIAKKSKL